MEHNSDTIKSRASLYRGWHGDAGEAEFATVECHLEQQIPGRPTIAVLLRRYDLPAGPTHVYEELLRLTTDDARELQAVLGLPVERALRG